MIYFVSQGSVNIISEESKLKKVNIEIRRTRRNRAIKKEQMRDRYPDSNPFTTHDDDEDFVSDFPIDSMKKGDYTVVRAGHFFGNDKILS